MLIEQTRGEPPELNDARPRGGGSGEPPENNWRSNPEVIISETWRSKQPRTYECGISLHSAVLGLRQMNLCHPALDAGSIPSFHPFRSTLLSSHVPPHLPINNLHKIPPQQILPIYHRRILCSSNKSLKINHPL